MTTPASRPTDNPPSAELTKWLATLVRRSRQRAIRDALDHDIPDDYAKTLFHEQQGRCAITGRPFDLMRFSDTLVKASVRTEPSPPQSFKRIRSWQCCPCL